MKEFFKNLGRYKLSSVLNILGLGIAFAAAYAILVQVNYDLSYNRSLKDAERVFRLEHAMFAESEEGSLCDFMNDPLGQLLGEDTTMVECFGQIIKITGVKESETLFFICDDKKDDTEKKAGHIRTWLAAKEQLDLIRDDAFEFCFIVDFPMYEIDEETGATIFTHNPFSMPQGGMDALLGDDPTKVLAYQYDLVCNGIELASGAVRNHDIDIMKKAFEIAGYTEAELKTRFNALYTAFQYGAPPHAGMAPGVDRMVMLLTDEEKIMEVIAFPLNGNAQDLLLGAPSEVTNQQLEDVHLLGSTNALASRGVPSGNTVRSEKRETFSNSQQLNQLSLTDAENDDMQKIFDMMKAHESALKSIDTENVEEMIHVMPMTNVLREDERKQTFTRESLLEGAPQRNEDSWQVPRLVK